MEYKEMGRKIKQHRMRSGLSQEALAETLEISRNYLSSIERGVKTPSLDMFVKICNELEVSADELLAERLNNRYVVKASILAEKMEDLVLDDQERVLNVVEALLK